jgi:DNA-binding protein YbaB
MENQCLVFDLLIFVKQVKRMDTGLKEIEQHFSSWKIKLNSAKTESILFTKSTIMQKKMDSTKVKINDNELEWKSSVKYLGVVLDSKLTFKTNLKRHLKARKAMATLSCLLKKNSTDCEKKLHYTVRSSDRS